MRISSPQIINFIKTQSAFVGLLPSHTWRCARRGRELGQPLRGGWRMCSGRVDERGSGLWKEGGKQMGGGPGFDVRITSPSEGQPRLDLELCVSWNAGVNSPDSCLHLHPLPTNTHTRTHSRSRRKHTSIRLHLDHVSSIRQFLMVN